MRGPPLRLIEPLSVMLNPLTIEKLLSMTMGFAIVRAAPTADSVGSDALDCGDPMENVPVPSGPLVMFAPTTVVLLPSVSVPLTSRAPPPKVLDPLRITLLLV